MRAGEDVEGEDAAQEFGPRRARRARAGGGAGRGRRVGRERAAGRRSGCGRVLGDDEVAPGGRRREHAVVGELMGAWGWHECRQPLDEGERIEGDGGCAVAPMAFEAVDDSAVRCEHEALGRDGWGRSATPSTSRACS